MVALSLMSGRNVPVAYFNVKLAKRASFPLSLWEITSDLAAVVMQPSRVASSSIRAGERGTGMAGFIIRVAY